PGRHGVGAQDAQLERADRPDRRSHTWRDRVHRRERRASESENPARRRTSAGRSRLQASSDCQVTIRARLTIGFVIILSLFAVNEGIQVWSARLRAQTMSALDVALKRQVLMGSVRQRVTDLHKQMQVLGQIENAAPVGNQMNAEIDAAASDIKELSTLT